MSSSTDVILQQVSFEKDTDLEKGFMVCGIVLIFLIFMVMLRFLTNLCIDVVVLRDGGGSFMRSMSEFRRCLVPTWHPRTEPQQGGQHRSVELSGGRVEASPGDPDARHSLNMDHLLRDLSENEKLQFMQSILTSRTVTLEDLSLWKREADAIVVKNKSQYPVDADTSTNAAAALGNQDHQPGVLEHDDVRLGIVSPSQAGSTTAYTNSSSSSTAIICPICIHDLEIGQTIVQLPTCNHRFHRDCLSKWLSTMTRDCPYCRTEIVTDEMLHRAMEARRQRQDGNEWTA